MLPYNKVFSFKAVQNLLYGVSFSFLPESVCIFHQDLVPFKKKYFTVLKQIKKKTKKKTLNFSYFHILFLLSNKKKTWEQTIHRLFCPLFCPTPAPHDSEQDKVDTK